ncbi:MAG: sugar ABC transporter ATP-binding protein [Clostridium sp.]|nr:sugar ABC transporter ATP-binding protein [Clostridium sp.]
MKHTLTITGIKKYYPGVKALDWNEDQRLELESGKSYALVGENGAGKSTLSKILAGIEPMTAGEILLDNQVYNPANSKEARDSGIGIVLQEPGLIPSIKVSENLLVRNEKTFSRCGLYDIKKQQRLADEILAPVCPEIRSNTIVGDLTLEEQKLVEFARAIQTWPKVLLIDETSAALSRKNVGILFEKMREARENGSIVLFVTHRMGEIFEMCDEAVILKDGVLVDKIKTSDTDEDKISAMMVGREIDNSHVRDRSGVRDEDDVVLSLKNLTLQNEFKNISLDVKRGHVIGIGGLSGGGKDEILPAVFGSASAVTGQVVVNGEVYDKRRPSTSIDKGMAYIPRNREKEGLILLFTIRENIVLLSLKRIAKFGFVNGSSESSLSNAFFKKLSIKANHVGVKAGSLSGGNRQKIIVARWLARDSKIMLFDNPTRGIDVGARKEIYNFMNEMTQNGACILMVTDDLPELISMSDEIYIVRKGEISAHFDSSQNITEQELVRYMI